MPPRLAILGLQNSKVCIHLGVLAIRGWVVSSSGVQADHSYPCGVRRPPQYFFRTLRFFNLSPSFISIPKLVIATLLHSGQWPFPTLYTSLIPPSFFFFFCAIQHTLIRTMASSNVYKRTFLMFRALYFLLLHSKSIIAVC